MKFQITTDYAVRIILFLSQQKGNGLFSAKEVSEELGISYNYFNKISPKMKQHGFLESVQGPSGGYRLAKAASDISLYDVVQAMEGDICINRCLEEDGYCSRNATAYCPVHNVFESLQNQIIGNLKNVKISDLNT